MPSRDEAGLNSVMNPYRSTWAPSRSSISSKPPAVIALSVSLLMLSACSEYVLPDLEVPERWVTRASDLFQTKKTSQSAEAHDPSRGRVGCKGELVRDTVFLLFLFGRPINVCDESAETLRTRAKTVPSTATGVAARVQRPHLLRLLLHVGID